MLRKSTVSFISTSTRRLHSRAGHFRSSIPNTSGTSVLANPDLLVHHGMQKLFHSNSKPYDSPTKEASSKCPFSQLRNASSEALEGITAQTSGNNSPLSIVPTIPIFGSFFSIIPGIGEPLRKYFNVPKMLPNNIYDYYLAMNKQYGDFYVLNVPGIGKIHSINDPSEMMKVLRSEGAYPIGGISTLRAFIKWSKARNLTITNGEDNGFFGQGDTWRTIRTFMQSDLLSPQSARGYVPGIVEAAKIASKGAEYYADDLNTYFNYCAFDMFQTIMFGELTETANPSTYTDPINQEFVENSILSLNLMLKQNFDMVENIKGRMGITTPTYRKFEVALDRVNEIANDKINAFKKKWERGELNESELSSYIAHAFERQKEGEAISPETLREITMITLNSGVDTTSNFICWAMVHLSLNPDVQEKLYQELKENVDKNEGTLSSDIISKSKSPYLHAVLRESHRLTPVQPSTMLKVRVHSPFTFYPLFLYLLNM